SMTAQIATDGDNLVITIADNGVGLPADRDSIMEPYVTMREGGTGLGLAIVKKIVEEHGGDLRFADRPGGGTIAIVTLHPQQLAGRAGAMAATQNTPARDGKDI
ncbi:MAG: ATP-binding protein, partial [Sphingopyxis sp.]